MKREDKIKLLNATHKELLANIDKLKAYDTYKGKLYKNELELIGTAISACAREYKLIANGINEQVFSKARS